MNRSIPNIIFLNARRSRAFTLIEMVMAMAIASLLFVAMGSAIVIAAKAIPGSNDPFIASTQAARTTDLMVGEIESAVYISGLTATSIAFTVADRDGDGIPERISYSWSGAIGDPLLRSYNGATPVAIVDHVNSFQLVPNYTYVSESYPGPGVEDSVSSVLQDCTSINNLNSQSLGSGTGSNLGQYFAPSLTPDVIAWRPTSVQISEMVNRTPGSFAVQMRPANVSLVPTNTVLEQIIVNSASLPLVMLPQTYNFYTLNRQAAGNSICLALMFVSGQGAAKFQSTGALPGLLKTNNTPTSWSYVNNNAISAQLYGVPMRSGPTQTKTTQYLLNLSVSLGAGSSVTPVIHTSALAMNHPELLGGLLELKFDRDPTTVDVNGDGITDWSLVSGAKFNPTTLAAGVWSTSSDTLVSGTASEFNVATVADVRMQSMANPGSANVTVNTAKSGNQYASLTASLALQLDGTQTLTITQATSSSTSVPLIQYAGLPAQPTDLHMVIDPVAMGVAVSINSVQKGTLPISRINTSGSMPLASLYASGGTANFSYARVRILRSMP